jgi:hypothetical protein
MGGPSVRRETERNVRTLRGSKRRACWARPHAPVPDSSPDVNENKKDPIEVEAAVEALNVALRLHIIMRKQEQVDALIRASGGAAPG